MSLCVGGGRRFVIDLEDMSGAMILAGLVGPPAAERFSERRRGMTSDAVPFEPERPRSVEVLANKDAAVGIAAAVGTGRDIEDQSAEADRVIVGHSGFVGEGDELIALGSADLAEGRAGKLGALGEASVEAGKIRLLKPGVGRTDLGDSCESHLGDEAILEGSALTLDAALALRGEGRDGLRTQLLEDASDVSREADPGQFFLMAPVEIVAEESTVAVLIDGRGDAVTPEDHVQEPEVTDGILLGPEEGSQDGPGRVVGGMEEAHGRSLRAEPLMGTAVPLHEEPDLGAAGTAAPVLGRSATPLGTDPGLAQPATDRLPPDPKTFPLLQHLDEVGVVELGVDLSVEHQDAVADLRTPSIGGRTAPVAMSQALRPFPTIAGQESFGLSVTDLHEDGPRLQRKCLPDDLIEDLHPLHLTPA
jgi:hypothetical protein